MTCEPMDVDMSANLTFAIDTFPHRTRLVLALRYRGPPLPNPADGTVWGPHHAFAISPAGKRSDIDSWDLIQSVPEPRSLGSALPGGHSATALVAQIQLLDLESDRGLFPSITLNLVLDGLSLIERAQTSLLNSRNVDEHVLAATA